jgi:hypothetical protein
VFAKQLYYSRQGILTEGGCVSTIDLLIKMAGFVKICEQYFNAKTADLPVRARRSTVLSLPLQ